ncbi:hypothetical protein Poly30_57030 [Planctomycetes bacterium Poly30]|uniref:Uncharacterized protein n=1 Tax=Saltatorellus ferox TaxID=2528018 RepID=A0A518F1C4_9BACT|nr:hypothetical protein Poly30_57030 [Planctomycetes bacterium Poly30]
MSNQIVNIASLALNVALASFVLSRSPAAHDSEHITIRKISLQDSEGRIVGEIDGEHYGGPEIRLGSIRLNDKQAWSVILSGSSFRGPGLRIKDPFKPLMQEHIYLGLDGQPANPLFGMFDQRGSETLLFRVEKPQGGLIVEKVDGSGKQIWTDKLGDK